MKWEDGLVRKGPGAYQVLVVVLFAITPIIFSFFGPIVSLGLTAIGILMLGMIELFTILYYYLYDTAKLRTISLARYLWAISSVEWLAPLVIDSRPFLTVMVMFQFGFMLMGMAIAMHQFMLRDKSTYMFWDWIAVIFVEVLSMFIIGLYYSFTQ